MNTLLKNPIIFPKTKVSIVCVALVGGLAFAPFEQPAALLFSLFGLFSILYREEKIGDYLKKALLFNFCYFLSQLYWVAWSVKVYGAPELMPLVLLGLPLVLGLFPTVCLAPAFYRQTSRTTFGWTAGLGLWISEVFRSFAFTGFPWNLSGYVWDVSLSQGASVFGIFGLSLLTIMGAIVLFTRQKIMGAVIFSSLLGLWIYGDSRLGEATKFTQTTIRLVQPCVNQEDKWKPEFLKANLDRLEFLTSLEGEPPIDINAWPEAAVPMCIDEIPELKKFLSGVVDRGVIITGAPRRLHNPERAFSGVYVIEAAAGTVTHVFDKFHLVPFGEYVPLKWLNPFPKLTHGKIDYSGGDGAKTISLPRLKEKFSPIICYEGIFSGAVIDSNDRPDWILNLTNDGWFGNTSGPYQHLKIVRLRAIEEGLPIIRVANNGISAVIDAYGRIWRKLDLDTIGYIDSFIPAKTKITPYKKALNFFVDKVVGK